MLLRIPVLVLIAAAGVYLALAAISGSQLRVHAQEVQTPVATATAPPEATSSPVTAPAPGQPTPVPPRGTACRSEPNRLARDKIDEAIGAQKSLLDGATTKDLSPERVGIEINGEEIWLQGAGDVVQIIIPPDLPDDMVTAVLKVAGEVNHGC